MALLIPLLPYIRNDFSLTYAKAGWLSSAYNFSYGMSQLPSGWLTDRFGPRVMLLVGVSGAAVIGLLVGVSPNYIFLVALLVILGLAGGGYHPAAAPLVSASVSPEKRGRALGLHQIGGSASFFLAPLIAAGIAGLAGWRGTFISVSIPSIIFGIIFYILLGKILSKDISGQKSPVEYVTESAGPRQNLRLAVFLILGISSMVTVYLTISFIPLYLVDSFGMSEQTAAAMLSIAYSGGIWAGPLGGYLSDKLGRIPVILSTGFIAALSIYLFDIVSQGFGLTVALILLGMAMNVGMPVVEAYIITHVPLRQRSTLLGLYYMGSRGGLALAPLIGFVIDRQGFTPAFTMLSAVMLGIAVLCGALLLVKRGR